MDKTFPLPKDPNSYSKPEHAVTSHFDLDWTVNFTEKTLSGSVLLHLDVKDNTVNQLVLDSSSLKISKVICEDSGQALKFEVGKPDPNFGSQVTISLPSEKLLKKLRPRIFYSTSPAASGLAWLSPGQTSGKKYPFVFSQCQPIHARSLMPCQDTPQVKSTYNATVKCESSFVALMSALRDRESSPTPQEGLVEYKFRQPVAMPSYLVAIVVGDLCSEVIGPRSHVWAEKEVVKKAAYEFGETERMLKEAEGICGPYVWGEYDLLVLPPSFPYGGMENPCLTFVTPTLLAGDRSLATVITHEICHSWTGNLVTNCNWEHFWLNEGFTVFLERKVLGRMAGEKARHMSAIDGWNSLKYCIETRGKKDPLTCLVPSLGGIDPDDAFSAVPYEKGHSFLWYLEELLGGPAEFEPFLAAYLSKFSHAALDTASFRRFLCSYFGGSSSTDKEALLQKVDWDAWLHTPGMPPYQPKFDTSLVDACYALCKRWVAWAGDEVCPFTPEDLEPFSSNQIVEFLNRLLDSELTLKKVKEMDRVYSMGERNNSEVKFRWLRLSIQVKWEEKVALALDFVNEQGRMKFLRPIYKDLYAWESARSRAVANFVSQRGAMMHVAAHCVAKDLGMEEEEKK